MPVVLEAGPWWAFVVRGAFGILFAPFMLAAHRVPTVALVTAFGTWTLVDGIVLVVQWIARSPEARHRGWVVLPAFAAAIVASVLALNAPRLTAVSLLYVIAASMIVRGILEIAAAIPVRTVHGRERLVLFGGYLSVMVGLVLMTFPGAAARGVLPSLSAYALVFGGLLLTAGLKLRAAERRAGRRRGLAEVTGSASR